MISTYFRVLTKSFKLRLAKLMVYKVSFLFRMLAWMVFDFIGPIFALVVYANSAGFPGWTFWQYILFNGAMVLVWAIAGVFVLNLVGTVSKAVREGYLDRTKVRPLNTLGLSIAKSIDVNPLSSVLVGLFLIILAITRLGSISGINIVAFAGVSLLAIAFLAALAVFVAAIAFISVKSQGLWQILHAAEEYASYPLNIYPGGLKFAFTFILPVGLAGFYPAQALLGRLDLGLIPWLVLVTFSFLTLALLFWSWALKRYTSAGG